MKARLCVVSALYRRGFQVLDLGGRLVLGSGRETVAVTRRNLTLRNAYVRGARLMVREAGSGLRLENVVFEGPCDVTDSEGGLVGVVQVHAARDVRVRKCRLSGGGTACCGLYVADGAQVLVAESECRDNRAWGVFATGAGTKVALLDSNLDSNATGASTVRHGARVAWEKGGAATTTLTGAGSQVYLACAS
ncbi:unnamed protein product [Pedinophyceae sp. YPF-701]|nr:unnamed protein product [Pedinophyceae sp. YPF-701]